MAAAETAVSAIDPIAAIVRTSLIVGTYGTTSREPTVHEAVADPLGGSFYTDEIRSPVSRDDLVAAVWVIAASEWSGVHSAVRPRFLPAAQHSNLRGYPQDCEHVLHMKSL